LILHWNGTAWKKVPSPNPGGPSRDNGLRGVAATSAGNALAVGVYSNGTSDQTLVARWNGTAWKKVPSPDAGGPSASNFLVGVAASSANNAWAVGYYGTPSQTLAVHCC
jgi:hypothetical protein